MQAIRRGVRRIEICQRWRVAINYPLPSSTCHQSRRTAIPNMGLRNVSRGTSRPNWEPLRFKNGATTEPRNSSLARLSWIRASLHHTQHEIKCVALVTPLGSQPLVVIELYNRSCYNILMALWVVVVNSMVGQRFEGDAAAPHWWSCNALIILC